MTGKGQPIVTNRINNTRYIKPRSESASQELFRPKKQVWFPSQSYTNSPEKITPPFFCIRMRV